MKNIFIILLLIVSPVINAQKFDNNKLAISFSNELNTELNYNIVSNTTDKNKAVTLVMENSVYDLMQNVRDVRAYFGTYVTMDVKNSLYRKSNKWGTYLIECYNISNSNTYVGIIFNVNTPNRLMIVIDNN